VSKFKYKINYYLISSTSIFVRNRHVTLTVQSLHVNVYYNYCIRHLSVIFDVYIARYVRWQ